MSASRRRSGACELALLWQLLVMPLASMAADGGTSIQPGDGLRGMVDVPIAKGPDVPTIGVSANRFMNDPQRTDDRLPAADRLLPGEMASAPCPVGPASVQPLSLEGAIDLALCNSPLIQSAWAAIKVQSAAVGEAKAAYLPVVSAGVTRSGDRTTYPGIGSAKSTQVGNSSNAGVNWRLFDFGGRAASRQGAEDLLNAAIASHDAAIQKALESAVGAYFDAQSAKAALIAKQEGESLARETLAASRRRESHGAGSRTETLQAEAGLAKAALDRSRAHGDVLKAMAQLTYALGLPPATDITLATDLADDARDLGPELAQWLADAQAVHPAILAAKAQLAAARERVTVAESSGRPTLDASLNFYRNGRPSEGLPALQTTERVVAVTLNVPLFDGFSTLYKVRGAQAEVEQRTADLQDLSHQILLEVLKAHADAVAALDNLDLSRTLVTTTQSAMESVRQRFDHGASDILEMLSAQAALADARQQQVRCLAEWRSARLRLLAAAGKLGHANLH
jgi:outer membrane protein